MDAAELARLAKCVGVGDGSVLGPEEVAERWGEGALNPSTKFDSHVPHKLVAENVFRIARREQSALPLFEEAKGFLPKPVWEGRESDVVQCYWRAWELAYASLRQPTPESHFVSNFIDTAFNDCLFMWDSSFIVMFGRYAAHHAQLFHNTLNNLYCRQHPDGYICREIKEDDGRDMWHRFEVCGTGPNILAWAEWEFFKNTGNVDRVRAVFPVLVAFHDWFHQHRSWQDGTYFSSGGGCGMDNQPRAMPAPHLPPAARGHTFFSHAHMSWIDTSFQQLLNCNVLIEMSEVVGRQADVAHIRHERELLARVIHTTMWDPNASFYCDKATDGALSSTHTIGAYWGLLTRSIPSERVEPFVAHLRDPESFNRPHRIPSLSAKHPSFRGDGGYWLGGVWAPTNYMALKGLVEVGFGELAHDIAVNHVDNVAKVFAETGTLWENYSPESEKPGNPAKRDFVGWTGIVPICVLFEHVFGIRPLAQEAKVVWDVRLLERHGVEQYPFMTNVVMTLLCSSRRTKSEAPVVTAGFAPRDPAQPVPDQVTVEVAWAGAAPVRLVLHKGQAPRAFDLN